MLTRAPRTIKNLVTRNEWMERDEKTIDNKRRLYAVKNRLQSKISSTQHDTQCKTDMKREYKLTLFCASTIFPLSIFVCLTVLLIVVS